MKKYLFLLSALILSSSNAVAMSKKPVEPKFKTVYMEIASFTRPCEGIVPQQCMQYKELSYVDGRKVYKNNEWYNFYDTIQGFKLNPNKQVVLKLKAFEVIDPPADASSSYYVLEKVIEETSVTEQK